MLGQLRGLSRGMLTSYEQFYIQILHQEGKLIPEQYPGEMKRISCAIACNPDTYPTCLHLTSNQQQPKVCTFLLDNTN